MDWGLPGTRRIRLPDAGPAPWVHVDRDMEVAPWRTGLSGERIEAIWSAVEAFYGTRVHPALTFCLRYRGRVVLNRSIGYARGLAPERPPAEDARPALPDTPVCLFSASKAIIALLTHKLAEEGGVSLDAPVARYLPAFAAEGKSAITLADVLSHRGGFPQFPIAGQGPEILADWDGCIERICAAPASGRHGRPVYHAMTGGFVLGEVIRRVTGAPLTDYLNSRLRRPLGMRYFTYGLDGRSRGRVAVNHVAGMPVRWPISAWARAALGVSFDDVVDISNRDMFMDAVIPSGNLYATAEELSRFYQLLLDDGCYEGQRLFAPATVARARRAVGHAWPDPMLKVPLRYSEGLMLGTTPIGLYGPMSGESYGHLGFMNILGWADPSRDIACGLLTTGKAVLGGHLLALSKLLATINRHCGAAG
ncbi:serine hydrolase [Salinisphaera sp. Q1T1-3]|uniref:serine hydrolase domain-containing protein n=1 Tax=Salinisphaera sp. Q1T1-3 TaxID=2321229 RepID=UPI000E71807C|nr:serine hydrolase domain-containing protein [Salinisphaera sp. Q1T1-3]RJS91959.1 class A beta-lactamase-related serine hydrolase [Salinisphaera sp. Q1T1-3]